MATVQRNPFALRTGSPYPTGTTAGVTWHQIMNEPATTGRSEFDAAHVADWSADVPTLLTIAAGFRAPRAARPEAALPYLDAADDLIADAGIDPEYAVVSRVLRSISSRSLGYLDLALSDLADASVLVTNTSLSLQNRIALTALIEVHRGVCELLLAQFERARRSLAGALRLADDALPASTRIEAHGCLALTELTSGSIANVGAHITLAASIDATLSETGVCGLASRCASAALAVERGEADSQLASVESLVIDARHTEYEPFALQTLANIHREMNDVEATIDALQQIQLLTRDWTSTSLPHTLHDLASVDVLIRHKQTAAAHELLDALESDQVHSICLETSQARIELEAGNPEGAVALIAPCVSKGDRHAPLTLCYALAVSAAAHIALGDNATAGSEFTRLLGHLAIFGLRRPMTSQPRALARRLIEQVDRSELSPRALQVIADLARVLPPSEPTMPKPLSAREVVILHHLSLGASHTQIAATLHVSPNTVKSQVRSVYRKLGVASRSGALMRARSLGISSS